MEIEFFGAAGEVTGSCHIVRCADKTILLDCGMIQGGRDAEERNRESFPFNPGDIDAVILSHGHIDHSGRLPLLVRRGFKGPIYCHNATKDLTRVLLLDSAKIAKMDAERRNRGRMRRGETTIAPLYDTRDAQAALRLLKGQRYRSVFDVAPGIKARFRDAGHILGSTSVEVLLEEGGDKRRLVFSGDLGQYDTPILNDPEALQHADLIVMESTYGGRNHRSRDATVAELADIVMSSAGNGNVLIPAFAIGRSQEILYQFGKHFDEWQMNRWDIFLDSPMAIEATEIYWDYPHLYDDEATKLRSANEKMPLLPNLHLTRKAEESRAINRIKSGAIILAGSGMCNGGRILHHLKHNLWRAECSVIIPGYQARGSLGRQLVDGDDFVTIHGDKIRVAARIHTIGGLSAHGDQQDLSRWYQSFEKRPPVRLVHGEPHKAQDLGAELSEVFGTDVALAQPGMVIDLKSV